jgi:protease I
MNKTIGMLIGPQFEDLEFWSVAMRLKEQGYQTLVIGFKAGELYPSKSGGLTAKADVGSADVLARELHGLAVPGGFAPDKMRRDPHMLRLIREMDEQKKVIGFICHAGWMAASAKILKGRRCTGSLGIKDDLENAGGLWVDQPAFQEGNLVWGRVVEDIPEYQRTLIQALESY